MPRNGLKTRVKPTGVKILLYALVALISINLFARFGIVDFTSFQPDLITLVAVLFVATEIGVVSALRGRRKLDGLQWFGTVVVFLAIIALFLGWVGMSLTVLNTYKGLIEIALLVFVIIEIFR